MDKKGALVYRSFCVYLQIIWKIYRKSNICTKISLNWAPKLLIENK